MHVFEKWVCVFPGKMGLSWKLAHDAVDTKEEAEAKALKNCNVVAIPLQLYDHVKEMETRMVVAENNLQDFNYLCRRMDEMRGLRRGTS